ALETIGQWAFAPFPEKKAAGFFVLLPRTRSRRTRLSSPLTHHPQLLAGFLFPARIVRNGPSPEESRSSITLQKPDSSSLAYLAPSRPRIRNHSRYRWEVRFPCADSRRLRPRSRKLRSGRPCLHDGTNCPRQCRAH